MAAAAQAAVVPAARRSRHLSKYVCVCVCVCFDFVGFFNAEFTQTWWSCCCSVSGIVVRKGDTREFRVQINRHLRVRSDGDGHQSRQQVGLQRVSDRGVQEESRARSLGPVALREMQQSKLDEKMEHVFFWECCCGVCETEK